MKNSFENPPNIIKKTNEQYRAEYLNVMKTISEEFNRSHQVKFLSDDGTVNMEEYGKSEEGLAEDYKQMKTKEIKWISEKKCINPDLVTKKMHQEWLEKQKDIKNKKSDILEMVTVLLLRKGLNKEFEVVRASKYDDYNGVDIIIVHITTGTIICAFDDVHDFIAGESNQKKIWFEKQSAKNGGSTIEYGFTFDDGKFAKRKVENVPKLYMQFSPIELGRALEDININNIDSLENQEIKYFTKMIKAFEDQLPLLEQYGKNNPNFLKNVSKFKDLLPGMMLMGNKPTDEDFTAEEGSMRLAA
jgi:hypothetical protein